MKECTPAELEQNLIMCLRAGIPAMVWGPGGIGKSEIAAKAAAAYGGGFIDFRANLREPVDLMGVPSIIEDATTGDSYTKFNQPLELPRGNDLDDSRKGVMLIDELPNASRATQAALYQLIYEPHRIGDYYFPAGWRILAAGNRVQDGGGSIEMSLPLKSRFLHFELVPDVDDWLVWASGKELEPTVMGFVRWQPELLHKVDPAATASPTPRTWYLLSNIMKFAPKPVPVTVAQAAVGEAAARQLVEYIITVAELPKAEDVLRKPSLIKDKADRPDILYALNEAISRLITDDKTSIAAAKYMDHVPPEFGVMLVRTVVRRSPHLVNTPGISKWLEDNNEVMT